MLICGVFNTKYKLILLKAEEKNNMKKSIIAGAGVAALGFAALPFAGVFAATSSSFTDTLKVGVDGGCTLENSNQSEAGDYSVSDRSFTIEHIAAGTIGYLNATNATTPSTTNGTVTISCNTGESTDTYTVDVTVDGLTGTNTSEIIAGGAQTTGADSKWAIKSNATITHTQGTDPTNPFADYAAAATGTFLKANATDTVTFNPSYRVYVAPDQEPDTYVGHAVYNIALD